jgi:hypothetical protein
MLRTRSSLLPIEDQPRRDPFGHYALRNNSRKQRWVLALLGISGRSVRLLAGARMACWLQQKRCAALLRLCHLFAYRRCCSGFGDHATDFAESRQDWRCGSPPTNRHCFAIRRFNSAMCRSVCAI